MVAGYGAELNAFAYFPSPPERAEFLPLLVDPIQELDNATPSVQSDYRTFVPTTGCSTPVPRLGTLILAGTTRLDFSLRIGATGSHVPRKSQMQSHAAFMPDAVRTVIRAPPDSCSSRIGLPLR
jgi:hypothetical protein